MKLAFSTEQAGGIGFAGRVSFEWEKRWHPAIAEPEVALPRYVRLMRGLLA